MTQSVLLLFVLFGVVTWFYENVDEKLLDVEFIHLPFYMLNWLHGIMYTIHILLSSIGVSSTGLFIALAMTEQKQILPVKGSKSSLSLPLPTEFATFNESVIIISVSIFTPSTAEMVKLN